MSEQESQIIYLQSLIRGYQVRRIHNKKTLFQRHQVIQEFSSTEISFSEQIRKMYTYFSAPLIDLAEKPETTILPKLMIESVFPRIENVYINGCIIANTFEEIAIHWKYDSTFNDALMKCLNLMMPLSEYTLLFENQKRSMKMAYEIKGFNVFIKKQMLKKELNGLNFNDLTIMPVQRLMRYPILLRELIKNTSIHHPEYSLLNDILVKFDNLIANVNVQSKMHDRLLDVSSCICSMENCVQSWRYCLYYGFAQINSLTSPFFMCLFNDRILYFENVCEFTCNEETRLYLEFEASRQIRFMNVKSFGPSAELPRTYELHIGDTVDYFYFPSSEKYDEWSKVLDQTLSQFVKFNKRYFNF